MSQRPKRQRTTMADAIDHAPPLTRTADLTRRKLLVSGCTLLVLPVIPSLAQAATILAVRTWPAAEYTRVPLEMDSELKADHFMLDNPPRRVEIGRAHV